MRRWGYVFLYLVYMDWFISYTALLINFHSICLRDQEVFVVSSHFFWLGLEFELGLGLGLEFDLGLEFG